MSSLAEKILELVESDGFSTFGWQGDPFTDAGMSAFNEAMAANRAQKIERIERLILESNQQNPRHPAHFYLLKMIAQRARHFPNFPLGYHIPEVFSAIGEEPPTPDEQSKVIGRDQA